MNMYLPSEPLNDSILKRSMRRSSAALPSIPMGALALHTLLFASYVLLFASW